MCDTSAPGAPGAFVPVDVEWSGQQIPLEPVDEVQVLTVCDNTIDIFLLDQGPARRLLSGGGRPSMLAAPTMLEGEVVDGPLAQHGFSALVTVRRGDRRRTVLFDTGITPDGCVENLRRIGKHLADIEAVVCSHGHFDHTAGLSGLAARLDRHNLPVVIHPEFWTRRRLAIPGREPLETPTTSRRALEEVGFSIIDHRAAAAVVPPRRRAPRHRRGRPDDRLRARVPHPPGTPRRRVGPRPAHPRRPGVDRERRREGPGRPHRLRSRRHRQHLPLRATAYR
jgi:7,8-dihydropterin-6-yl-methyl-4-(beta-D-ribofuranosyl)aminobenzene 5'-phosphate synthase